MVGRQSCFSYASCQLCISLAEQGVAAGLCLRVGGGEGRATWCKGTGKCVLRTLLSLLFPDAFLSSLLQQWTFLTILNIQLQKHSSPNWHLPVTPVRHFSVSQSMKTPYLCHESGKTLAIRMVVRKGWGGEDVLF